MALYRVFPGVPLDVPEIPAPPRNLPGEKLSGD